MHQFVEFVFRESEASKKLSICANSKKSKINNSTENLQSPKTVYYETDEEDSKILLPYVIPNKTSL